MTSSTNRPTGTKALLAIAFAGNLLSAFMPALGQQSQTQSLSTTSSPSLPSTSIVEVVAASAQLEPDEKAFFLLQLAHCYITETSTASLEKEFSNKAAHPFVGKPFFLTQKGLKLLAWWAEMVAARSHSAGTITSSGAEVKITTENRTRAEKAIEAAMLQLGTSFTDAQTANLFFVASALSRMTGNLQNEQKCNRILNDAIQACEGSKTVDSSQIKLVAPILNSMACVRIPVRIEDHPAQYPQQLPSFTTSDFTESEKLKLRALALLDRLPAADQERRKAHRDLSLWYSQLGKEEEALREKQELFNLVGVHDDRIMYPHYAMCGAAIWWTTADLVSSSSCGMG